MAAGIEKQVQGLVDKLNTVDFTEEEKFLLVALFQAAGGAEAEVEGFDNKLTPAQAAAAVRQMGGIRVIEMGSGGQVTFQAIGNTPITRPQ